MLTNFAIRHALVVPFLTPPAASDLVIRNHVVLLGGRTVQDAWTTSLDSVRATLDADPASDRIMLLWASTQELGPTRMAICCLDLSVMLKGDRRATGHHEIDCAARLGSVKTLASLDPLPGL